VLISSPMLRKSFGRAFLVAVLSAGGLTARAQNVVVSPLHTFNTLNAGGGAATLITSLAMGTLDGTLYGTTYQDQTNGTIFTLNPDGTGYSVLHTFAAGEEVPPPTSYSSDVGDGTPVPRVIQGSDGHLYGTMPHGGASGNGIVFKMNPNGSAFTVIHEFASSGDGAPAGLIQASDGFFYGVGASIFKIDSDGGNYTVLHTFNYSTDGSLTYSPLFQARDGALYGTAAFGGSGNMGTLFSINTNGTGFKVLHNFGDNDGVTPLGSLIQASDGALYGTTWDYETNGNLTGTGTAFKISTDGNNYKILHQFIGSPSDGRGVVAGLVEGSDHVLYGTTYLGGNGTGSSTLGTLYRITQDGSGYAVLYAFTNGVELGVRPITGLVKGPAQGTTGVFYGATFQGALSGNTGKAAVFALLVNPPALAITPLVNQTGSNQATLFWPAWAAKYSLQATTNPASGNWTTVTDAVPVYGAQVTTTNAAMFYRLVSP